MYNILMSVCIRIVMLYMYIVCTCKYNIVDQSLSMA